MYIFQKVFLVLGFLFGFTLLYLGVILIIQSDKDIKLSTSSVHAELNFFIGDDIIHDRNIWTSDNQDEINRTGNFSRVTITRTGGNTPQRVGETSITIFPTSGPSSDSDH